MENRKLARTENFSLFLSTRRNKVLTALVIVLMCLALVLRFLGQAILGSLASMAETVVSTCALLSVPTIAAFSTGALVVVVRRGADRCGWFLPRKRAIPLIISVEGNFSDILLIKGDNESRAISILKLLSVPSQGVRQRVRGAVSRAEQEEGAAVSDERQYQFSHLTSLLESARRGGATSYEIGFKWGIVEVKFTVSAKNREECARKTEQVKASVLSKFPIEVAKEKGERLKEAALMGFLSREAKGNDFQNDLQLRVVGDRIALVLGFGSPRYVAVVALVGRPEMSANEQRSQIDQLITAVNNFTGNGHHGDGEAERREEKVVDVNFIVSFQPSTPPNYPSDASLRDKLRRKPDVKASLAQKRVEVDAMEIDFGHRVGWWKVSAYAVVIGEDKALVESRVESLASILRSVWSGSHFSPTCVLLSSKEIVRSFEAILHRSLLPRNYVTEMSSMRLSSLVHIPEEAHAPLSRVTAPLFEAPEPAGGLEKDSGHNTIDLGEILSASGALYPLTLRVDVLGTHMVVFGETGSGKTCFTMNLLSELLGGGDKGSAWSVPFLVLDQKGEYRCLLSYHGASIVYFRPVSEIAPLWINLFDAQGDDPDTHAKYVFNILREILFANRTELTPQMERVLYDVLRMSVGGDWSKFNENLAEYLRVNGEELPQLGATVQGILNRVGSFTRPPLSHVFDCKRSNVNFSYLAQRNVIIDLSELRRQGTPEDVRLVANIIAKYVGTASLRRGAQHADGLRHLFVVDDALDVVPEILGKKTTAEVGIIEHMAMLLRATGQGLVVVSQRPNVSENVIGNSAVKVFFRSVVDSRDIAAWINLSEEQQSYLKVLPRREAIITIPQHPSAIRIKAQDVNRLLERKVTTQDIMRNNMVHYPMMYDMKRGAVEERLLKDTAEEMVEGQQEIRAATEGEGGSECEQQVTVVGGHNVGVENWEKLGVTKLPAAHHKVWSKLRTYLASGVAVDSDFASKVLGVSQPVAHRTMLSLRSAGLVGVAKVPNYAYGEGYQYLYYSQKKSIYGGGVIGYVRERVRDDLMGKEAVVELSPRDVPSADIIVEDKYPVVIHPISSGHNRLILSALKQRMSNAARELSSRMREGLRRGGGGVIAIAMWRGVAQELEYARRRGELGDSCLCVIPFSKGSVSLLADYVLNHIPLAALSGEEKEDEDAEKVEEQSESSTNKVERAEGLKRDARARGVEEEGEKRESKTKMGKVEELRERVLNVVRSLGGVEPRVLADRLGVALWRVSKVAKELKEKRLIKVARNLPYIYSLKKANATYYLDSSKLTALHDAIMNLVWGWNIALGGKSRDFSFQYEGKTWCTDGLLVNSGGTFILEVITGDYNERVANQLGAYSTQIGHMGIKGAIVVSLDSRCLVRVREEVTSRGPKLGEGWLLTALRSKDEKLQLRNLLLMGKPVTNHRNPTTHKITA